MSKYKAKDFIKYPMQPFNGYPKLFDADDNLILDVRGWGRLQYEIVNGKKVYNEKRGVEIQDEICRFIIEAINEKLERE